MAGLRNYKTLRLAAQDEADLAVFSASLQDAVAKIGDFAYLPEARRFAFVANRFLWECAGAFGPYGRVRVGVHFDDVVSVKHHHLRLDAKDAVISLLAVRFTAGEDGSGEITLDFAGGGAVQLVVETVNASMTDLSGPWRTRTKPRH